MTFTLNEITLLVIALAVGLVIGMMMGGGRYKRLWREEQMARRDATQAREARFEALDSRNRAIRHDIRPATTSRAEATSLPPLERR